jgi:hypothetical protein
MIRHHRRRPQPKPPAPGQLDLSATKSASPTPVLPAAPEVTFPVESPRSKSPKRTIEDRFANFHHQHPDVYTHLVRLARQARALGHQRIAIEMLWQVVRWERIVVGLPDTEEGGYKLNDHYRSRYARLIMTAEPDLEDLFETRTLRS